MVCDAAGQRPGEFSLYLKAKQPHTSTVKHGGENKGRERENMGVVLGLVLCCSLFPGWGGGGEAGNREQRVALTWPRPRLCVKTHIKWSVQIHARQNGKFGKGGGVPL